MRSLRLLFVFLSLIVVGVFCSDCDSDCDYCTEAKGASCWKDDSRKRDTRCESEIGKPNDRRFSFEHPSGNRCYCCPPKKASDAYKDLDTLKRKVECGRNCNACQAAENAAECWTSAEMRDASCGSYEGEDRRFSFIRVTGGDRCYCCPA